MKTRSYRSCVALLAACLAGCTGNGRGLDANGQPIGDSGSTSSGPITADFQSIQDNVFTPICSKCHIGASAPEGLQLDAAHSYNLLVGVPSVEDSSLLRVKPGDPADSYMFHKIEGAPGIEGGQMPLGETPLPQATLEAISQWIMNGAQNAAVAIAAFDVQTTAPLDRAVVHSTLHHIVVTFTQEVDASLVNGSTVWVERLSAMDVGAPQTVPAANALAGSNPAVLLITPTIPLAAGTYRVTVRGTGGGAVANLAATTLGSDRTFVFSVESVQ